MSNCFLTGSTPVKQKQETVSLDRQDLMDLTKTYSISQSLNNDDFVKEHEIIYSLSFK